MARYRRILGREQRLRLLLRRDRSRSRAGRSGVERSKFVLELPRWRRRYDAGYALAENYEVWTRLIAAGNRLGLYVSRLSACRMSGLRLVAAGVRRCAGLRRRRGRGARRGDLDPLNSTAFSRE